MKTAHPTLDDAQDSPGAELTPPASQADGESERVRRKTAPRFVFQVPVQVEFGTSVGTGQIHDMSPTGARIEACTLDLAEGAKVRLRFRFFEDSPPMEVGGHVVRRTETSGLGIQFDRLDARARQALATLLPKVGTGRWRDATGARYTGRLNTPLGTDLHEACVRAAQAQGLSLDEWVLRCLETAARST